jgi:hypothetical protein
VRANVLVVASIAILAVGSARSAAGQQRAAPSAAPATLEDVLQELRALRAELKESAAVGLRAQLLVARLQLQEQRINTVWRQLSELDDKLQANEKNRAPSEYAFKMLGLEPGAAVPKEMAPMLEMFKQQAAAVEKTEAELKLRQTELMQLIAQEQSRWTTFNAQLEALEQALTQAPPRR